jgi:hypothetical protein
VRKLAESLKILGSVVSKAHGALIDNAEYSAPPNLRWDPASLYQIIGNYEETLQECYELLRDNKSVQHGAGPFRSIEWNVLVQPTVERLRKRIILHNSKISHVLKPFEM